MEQGAGSDAKKKKLKPAGTKAIKKPHNCNKCSKSFPTPSALVKHLRVHTGERPFTCDLCPSPKSFTLKAHLTRHRKLVHFPEQLVKLPCPQCGRTFKLKSHLVQHQLIHQDIKAHPCVFCPKKFKRRSTLHVHLRRHFQEKDCFCEFCPKSYIRNDLLQIHRSTHTGDKYFKCVHCPKTFSSQPHFIFHRRHVHKENVGVVQTCVFCADGFQFVTKERLTLHLLRKHLGEKPYFCKDCDMCFVNGSKLRVHANRKHKIAFSAWSQMAFQMRRRHGNEEEAK